MKIQRRRFTINLNTQKNKEIIEYLERSDCIQRVIVAALTEHMNREEVKKWQKPRH